MFEAAGGVLIDQGNCYSLDATIQEILEDYPDLEMADIYVVLFYAA